MGATGEIAALLIAQLDLSSLVLLGAASGLAADLAGAAGPQGYEPRVRDGVWADAAGAELVVLDAVTAITSAEIAARCSGAVVIVATASPALDVTRLLAETLLPRARIIGVDAAGAGPVTTAARAVQLVDAVLRDRRSTLSCAIEVLGPEGSDGVQLRQARVGAGGVQAIL